LHIYATKVNVRTSDTYYACQIIFDVIAIHVLVFVFQNMMLLCSNFYII
jgi:hypothetical protein